MQCPFDFTMLEAMRKGGLLQPVGPATAALPGVGVGSLEFLNENTHIIWGPMGAFGVLYSVEYCSEGLNADEPYGDDGRLWHISETELIQLQ